MLGLVAIVELARLRHEAPRLIAVNDDVALAPALAPLMPVPLDTGFSPRAILAGLAMGTGLTLLFALWPLLDIRRVPPALILRQDVEPRA